MQSGGKIIFLTRLWAAADTNERERAEIYMLCEPELEGKRRLILNHVGSMRLQEV
jgi:hypothetical protein